MNMGGNMRILLGITGASGAIYAVRLLKHLYAAGQEVHLIVTHSGRKVLRHECPEGLGKITGWARQVYNVDDMEAAPASGSFLFDAMAVVPCSMKTVGCIAHGISDNLLARAADVMIKERRQLLLVPRETPMSAIHLENLLCLSRLGVQILPACPAFYHRPQTLNELADMLAGKIMDALHLENQLFHRWPYKEIS